MIIILEEWDLDENTETGSHIYVHGLTHIDAYCAFLIFCRLTLPEFTVQVISGTTDTVIILTQQESEIPQGHTPKKWGYHIVHDEFVQHKSYDILEHGASDGNNTHLYN
jgi:hypothetical protein